MLLGAEKLVMSLSLVELRCMASCFCPFVSVSRVDSKGVIARQSGESGSCCRCEMLTELHSL